MAGRGQAAGLTRQRLLPAPAGQGRPLPWRRKERGVAPRTPSRRFFQHRQQSKVGNPRLSGRPHARPRLAVRASDLPLRPRSSRGAPLRATVTPVTPPEVSVELLLTRDPAPAGRPPPRGARGCGARSHRTGKRPLSSYTCKRASHSARVPGSVSLPWKWVRRARDPRTSPRGTRESLPSLLHLVRAQGLGSRSPAPASHTHHPETEVLCAGCGRCAAPVGRQREQKQKRRQPGPGTWGARSPGGSRSPRAASHPALRGGVARIPAPARSRLRASLGSAPAPLRGTEPRARPPPGQGHANVC